jgi:hypothetical protein
MTRVQIIGLNSQRPSQVEVLFVAGEHPGMKREVPITRLKVRWEHRAAYLEREAQWARLKSEPPEIEEAAVESIFREFIWPAAGLNGENSRRGTVGIHDEDLVDVFVGGVLEQVLADSPSILEADGTVHYGWFHPG